MPKIPDEDLKILQDKYARLFDINAEQGIITLKKGFKSQRTGKEIPRFEMVYIPSGEFMMGSEDGYDEEKPVHKVKISQPFFMGKFPVVQELYEAVTGENPSNFKGKQRPVERVNWYDAINFCKDLDKILDLPNPFTGEKDETVADLKKPGFRLPTEAEWEYAARGGAEFYKDGYEFAGSNVLSEVGWCKDNSWIDSKVVGLKLPNQLELYDMNGNVYEWCLDWFDKEFYAKNKNATDPYNTVKVSGRVWRGGAWLSSIIDSRVAWRYGFYPGLGWLNSSFRLVLGFRNLGSV